MQQWRKNKEIHQRKCISDPNYRRDIIEYLKFLMKERKEFESLLEEKRLIIKKGVICL